MSQQQSCNASLQTLADTINQQRIEVGYCPSEELMSYDRYLVVYASLAPGAVNQHILEPLDGSWSKATVVGELVENKVDNHWAAMCLKTEQGTDIEVQLFTCDQLAEHWNEIDAFEGDSYRRLLTPITLQDGSCLLANIYTLK
ncbi:gamma-glutamylcyclotransferase family protein [Pelagibaculum spongiae]|uniref:Gamma-glutamylcyclotransferase AIG2-like domain-containing protein n=1 Tax=Pelagibaculum spongiae TaxID=2080658 RepID=A0A2V1GY20_9GAMM|nr:gamma-glutamylcyclotransferase family protein [Pelagibaculum spongiae]PVZ70227.1 hypothetical protein DC094_06395 [Pelagibaculum spongiae]